MSKPRYSGIYRIRHLESGKCYIGSASNICERWYSHLGRLRKGNHHCRHLQFAWDKHGEDAFAFEVIERCLNEKVILVAREQFHIDKQAKKGRKTIYNSTLEAVPGYDADAASRITKTQIQQAFQDYASGKSIDDIAESLSTIRQYILAILGRRARKRVFIEPELADRVRAMLEKELSSEKRMGRKIPTRIILEIYEKLASGEDPFDLAEEYGISKASAYGMRRGKHHRELLDDHPSLREAISSLPPMNRCHFDEAEVVQIATMYSEGVSMDEITRKFQCKPEAVQSIASRRSYRSVAIPDNVLKECNARISPGKPGELNGNAKLSPSEVREICELRKSGMTLSAIANKFGVSISTIHRISRGEQYASAISDIQTHCSVAQTHQPK